MASTKREDSHIGLDAQWTIARQAWTAYLVTERALNAIPWGRTRLHKHAAEREAAVRVWNAARDTFRDEYRELKRQMRVAIQYKRL